MCNLTFEYKLLKQRYRTIFLNTAEEIRVLTEKLKPDNFVGEVFDLYEKSSEGRLWQVKVRKSLRERYLRIKKDNTEQIALLKDNYGCVCCGSCCRLACSEFSYEELQMKASNGDSTANEFLQTFVPFESLNEVKQVFPQYLELLENNNETDYHFYHCPKVTSDNKCPDYENRPKICRDFPDNPLAFLPLKCGFNEWKFKTEDISLKLSAESEIISFYINKLTDYLQIL